MTAWYGRGPGKRLTPEDRAQIEAAVIPMLLSGATYAQITREVGISAPTILRIRTDAGIPAAVRDRPARSVDETFDLYAEPYGDGHLRWTGPMRGRSAALCAEGRIYNPRVFTFEAHHGRPPTGRLFTSCDEQGCIAGAHLTDAEIRNSPKRGVR
jgi:hypothetical protein